MAYQILAPLFNLVNPSTFIVTSVLLVISFLVWEIPRSVRIFSEEYTRGLYPEYGRVVDIILFVIGLAAALFLYISPNAERLAFFVKNPSFFPMLMIILLVSLVVIIMGFLKRAGERTGRHESVTVFLVQTILDLAHSIFFISFAILLIPLVAFFIFGP